MFLRQLSVRGFKSFADRAVLEFTPGVSVIVGPNGSGKSNLVDAIAWVLGEQGPRALRGGQMADVIFAGSPSRPALGMAEVRLVIDNAAGLIPVPMTEIEISRTVFRSGDSEYRIGGQVCRLLDIQELLGETGLGRALHTVVGQGQLEDVLTARPEERRRYVEEAAGVAKHRRRKERAERKLAGLDQDLLRLQDVLGELRRQLKPLRQQAEMARKHEALTSEADEVAWRLAAARLRTLYRERDERRAGWEEGEALRRAARERLDRLDAGLATLAEERERSSAALRRAEEVHRAAADARAEAERALRVAVGSESEARMRLSQHQARSARLAALSSERDRAEATLAETAAALIERERELEAAEAGFREGERLRRDAEDERRRLTEEALAHRAEAETLRRSLASHERERNRLEHALSEARERRTATEAERVRLQGEIERLDAVETPLTERQAVLERERNGVAAEVEELDASVREAESRVQLLAARRRDLEETAGSRFLEAHPGRAIGLLRGLVRPEPALARALAAALGPLADAVVYEREDDALADARSGEGAVLAVASGDGPSFVLPGEQALLSTVTADPRVRGLLATVLRNVYLAEDHTDAAERRRRHPRASFVTPDGLLVGPAIVRTPMELDARAAELRRELAAAEHDLAAARQALRPARARLDALTSDLDRVAAELDRTDRLITAAAERTGRLGQDLASYAKEVDLLDERLAGLDEAAGAWRVSLASVPDGPAEPSPLPPRVEPPIALRVEVETLRRERDRFEATLARIDRERTALGDEDPERLAAAAEEARSVKALAEERFREAEAEAARRETARDEAVRADRDAADAEAAANRAWREAAGALDRVREGFEDADRARGDLERRIRDAERLMKEGHERDPVEAVAALGDDDTVRELERRSEMVARRLTLLGRVNLLAADELGSLQERHDFMARELEDVRSARRDLLEVIRQVEEEVVRLFRDAFDDVAAQFALLLQELFPGGEGRLFLTDPSDPLGSGIEVEARPGRKRVKRISLLSGGERALTALAFLFAIFRARPSPFYLLDEVEAALDDANLSRFLRLIQGFAGDAQVLVVTHQKRTMEVADMLYGVSMGKDGATGVVCQRLDHPRTSIEPEREPAGRRR